MIAFAVSSPDTEQSNNQQVPDKNYIEAVTRFLRDKQLRLSRRTIDNYKKTIGLFMQFVEEEPWPPSSDDIHDWLTLVKNSINLKTGKPISPNTVHTYWVHLKVFFNYCEETGFISSAQNPTAAIIEAQAAPKSGNLEPIAAPEETIITLLNYLKARASDTSYVDRCLIRDYTIILFLFTTGVRAGELINIRLADIDLAKRECRIDGETSKGSESRLVALDKTLCDWIRRWYEFRDQYFPDADRYLFVSYRGQIGSGKKLQPNAINQMLKRHAKAAGIPHSSTHKYRHAFAIGSLRDEVPTKYVQLALGHKTPDMTLKYYQRILREEHLDFYKRKPLSDRLSGGDDGENDGENLAE